MKTSAQPRPPGGPGGLWGQAGIPSLQGHGHPSSLPVSLQRLCPASLPSVIQAAVSPPGEVAAASLPAGQSQPVGADNSPALGPHRELLASAPWHRTGQEGSMWGTGTEAPRAHAEPARSWNRAAWLPAASSACKRGLSRSEGKFALGTHAGRPMAGPLPVLGLWLAPWGAGPQPSSSVLVLLVLCSPCAWCPFPGRTVAHVALRVSSHPGDDPDSKAFPSPAGAGSGPDPSQEVTEMVPGLASAQPWQHAGCIQAWGWALDSWQEEPPQHHSLPDPGGDPGSCSEPRSPWACLPPVGPPAWGSRQHPSASVTSGRDGSHPKPPCCGHSMCALHFPWQAAESDPCETGVVEGSRALRG